MKWYFAALKKYAVFTGRARRKEFWMFSLIASIIAFVFGFLDGVLGTVVAGEFGLLSSIYQLGMFLPAFAVQVRRLHDTNFRGWWLLTPVPLVLIFVRGTRGNNRFGPDPKAESMV